MSDKKMKIGFNTFDSQIVDDDDRFVLPERSGKGVDFVVSHFDPDRTDVEKSIEIAKTVGEKLSHENIEYIANFEFQNFQYDCKSPDGYDWANRPDGTHRLNLPKEYVEAHASNGNFLGVMHDELEHTIINRNLSIELASKGKIKANVFPLGKTNGIVEQSRLLCEQIRSFSDDIKEKGGKFLVGEHVFPVLFHTFAANGVIPNFKSQKESFSDMQFAVAAGAALQYKTPLFNCVDCWYRNTNPGHSPKEMLSNLEFAYYAGVDRVYVESVNVFTDKNSDGKYELNEYGRAFAEFSEKYRGKERGYNIENYRPQIGIIRFDDSYWGQGDPVMWKYMLFGNRKIKPVRESKEWIRAFNVITMGETGKNTLSWDKIAPWSLRRHRSFATMNSAAVFDGNVKKEELSSLKLCFLCGVSISGETLRAVSELVRDNGLTVVSPARFAPIRIAAQANGVFSEIPDGSGKWIITDDHCSQKVKKAVAPLLGSKGEIRLTFDDRETVLKISEDGETLTLCREGPIGGEMRS